MLAYYHVFFLQTNIHAFIDRLLYIILSLIKNDDATLSVVLDNGKLLLNNTFTMQGRVIFLGNNQLIVNNIVYECAA